MKVQRQAKDFYLPFVKSQCSWLVETAQRAIAVAPGISEHQPSNA